MGRVGLEPTVYWLKARCISRYATDPSVKLSRCWWSLNHPLRIPQNPVRGKWFVPVPKVVLAVWGLVPPPTHVIYHHFGLCGEIGGHLGNCPKQQKRGGNFWFLSPVFALWITSYICLSISANRGVPSICQ